MLEPTGAPSRPPPTPPARPPALWPIAAPMPPPSRAPRTGSPAEACVDTTPIPRAAAAAAIARGFFNMVSSFRTRESETGAAWPSAIPALTPVTAHPGGGAHEKQFVTRSQRAKLAPTKRRPTMYKRILLAYDGSEAGQKALLDCREIAQWSQSDLHLIAVMPPPAAFIGGEGYVDDGELEEEERLALKAALQDSPRPLPAVGRTA